MNTFIKYKDVLTIAGISNEDIKTLEIKWNESHRFYHNIDHLNNILNLIEEDKRYMYEKLEEFRVMVLGAFFHDAIYDPKKNDNEDESVKLMKSMIKVDRFIEPVEKIILITKKRKLEDKYYSTSNKEEFMIKKFWDYDNNILFGNFAKLLDYEHKIYKEYQYVDYDTYKKERIKFLKSVIKSDFTLNEHNLNALIHYVDSRKPKVGVYAGSFNPFTKGHFNILEKAEKIFDKVIIAYGHNPEKMKTSKIIPESISNRCFKVYDELLTDFITEEENKGQDITLIRGLRNGADLDYENNQMQFMKEMKSDLKITLILCDKEYEHISSSAIRSLYPFGEKNYKKYIIK